MKLLALVIFVVMGMLAYQIMGFELTVISYLALIYWSTIDFDNKPKN